jgi:hypothetical protein
MGEGIHVFIKSLPTIFPLLIKKIGFIVLIVITKSVSRFANLLKSLTDLYLFVISGVAVQIRPWAPDEKKGTTTRVSPFFFFVGGGPNPLAKSARN